VFPRIGVAAQPVKGSAVFWHNKDSAGRKILESNHGGCPVLYGTKWGEYAPGCFSFSLLKIDFSKIKIGKKTEKNTEK
jgi:hypothetical protein